MHAPTLTVPDDLRDVLDDLAVSVHRIVFNDASALADDPDEHPTPAWTCLADMDDAHRAAGNCRPATAALNTHLAALGHSTGTVQAFFDSGTSEPSHVATAITLSDGAVWVIDFTARQFDPGAPVPFVLPAGEWMARLADWAQTWGWRLRGKAGES